MGRMSSSSPLPEREHYEHAPPRLRSAYGAQAALALRMGRIGENGKRAGEKAFDNGSRKPVLLALGTVALIPIKATSLQSHGSRKIGNCIGKCQGLRMGQILPFAQHRAGDDGSRR